MVNFCIRIIARFFPGEKRKLLFRAGFFFAHERGVVKIVSALSRLGGGALGRVLELHAPGAVFLHERERILKRENETVYDALQTGLEILAAGDEAFDDVFVLPDGTSPFQ